MGQVCVITEGEFDKEILEAVLPEKVVRGTEFVVGSGRYSAQSLARSILAVEQVPVALVVDADTNDSAAIREQRELLQFLLKQVSPGVKFEVFLAEPEIETLLVEDMSFVERLARSEFSDLEIEFAKLQPKRFLLRVLNGEESYPMTLQKVLANLSSDEQAIKAIRNHSLVSQLCKFLLSIIEDNQSNAA